ncbi:hypothetical protein [Olivibacter jilunii]|uniref:hypothetical protein n=1 Tax=Olivibacter jilunii TaxID=985016 RepID=UPI0010300DD4|nr:hypothetical protein [Olivibacter jilunii]MCL4639714.1 hypothetical protein [Olivibacter sp. UJ_SKK_5.1]
MGTEMSFYKFIILLSLMSINFSTAYAQSLQLDTTLSDVYQFHIRKEDEEGFLITYYDAVDTKDNSKPFEIIITQTSSKLMNMNGVADGIEKNLKNYNPDSKLMLIKQEEQGGKNRRLYQFSSMNTTILMLMQESNDWFAMIEAEFPDDELKKMSIQKWQDIFWKAE